MPIPSFLSSFNMFSNHLYKIKTKLYLLSCWKYQFKLIVYHWIHTLQWFGTIITKQKTNRNPLFKKKNIFFKQTTLHLAHVEELVFYFDIFGQFRKPKTHNTDPLRQSQQHWWRTCARLKPTMLVGRVDSKRQISRAIKINWRIKRSFDRFHLSRRDVA